MASKLSAQQQAALKTWGPANLRSLLNAVNAKRATGGLPPYVPPHGLAPNIGGFSPFQMPDRPPPGTYDPSIDAQVAAGQRGFGDLQQDTGIANARGQDDFTIAQGELQRQLDRQLADAATSRTQGHQDYLTNMADRTRNYTNLGQAQTDSAVAAGVGAGGALQQALDKRMANQTREQGVADTGEQRAQQEYQLYAGSDGQGGRYRENYDTQLGQAGLGLSRGVEDRGNTLARAGRENTQLGLDAGEQRWYQATLGGYDPPQQPAGEHGTGPNAYRYVRTPKGTRRLLSTGYLVGK